MPLVSDVFYRKSVLLTGADLAFVNSSGDTALHHAACRGDPKLIQSMLEHGACVDARTPGGCTPLMAAALKAHANGNKHNSQLTIEKLIAANSDLNAVDEKGNTALVLAVLEDQNAVIISNCETRRVTASISITLIEAGQTFCLYQMHWLEACAASRCRPHDCKLKGRNSTAFCSTTRRHGNQPEHARARSACRSANCKRQHCTSPCYPSAKQKHDAGAAQSRYIVCCLVRWM